MYNVRYVVLLILGGKMLKTNKEKVVMQSVMGKIHSPQSLRSPYRIHHSGTAMALPGVGGITYNVKLGDLVAGLAGDHIEPGVSLQNSNESENFALTKLSCIGNEATVISGDAKGAKGVVTGKHGGIEHVMIHFDQEALEKMAIDDKIQIKSHGLGLALTEYPDIRVLNIDPELLLDLNIREEGGKLIVPVTRKIPAYLMGSGIGSPSSYIGDYDITTADEEANKLIGLETMRFGDIVLLEDCDNSFGRGYLKGARSIGVVIHSDCVLMGHGPGVTTILTVKHPQIEVEINPNANIMNFGRFKTFFAK